MFPLIIMVTNVSLDYHGQCKFPRHMLLMYPLIIMVTKFPLIIMVTNVSLDYHGQCKFPRHMLLMYPLITMVTNVSLDCHGH